MYICLCGYEPFFGMNEEQLIAANKKAVFEFHPVEWCGVSDAAKDLVSKRWMDGCVGVWVGGWVDGWMDGMDGLMDGWMEWMD